MTRRARFTIFHGLLISLALHSTVAVPFVARRFKPHPDEPPILILDLQSIVADDQAEQQILEQVKGTTAPKTVDQLTPVQDTPRADPPPETLPEEPDPVSAIVSPPAQEVSPGKDEQNVVGIEQQQTARTVKSKQLEDDELTEYGKVLSRKIRGNLVYSANARPATAVVSFAILADGNIRAESLKIRQSSGQPRLDASAVQSIRASVPFPAPPKELLAPPGDAVNMAIFIDFERRR